MIGRRFCDLKSPCVYGFVIESIIVMFLCNCSVVNTVSKCDQSFLVWCFWMYIPSLMISMMGRVPASSRSVVDCLYTVCDSVTHFTVPPPGMVGVWEMGIVFLMMITPGVCGVNLCPENIMISAMSMFGG